MSSKSCCVLAISCGCAKLCSAAALCWGGCRVPHSAGIDCSCENAKPRCVESLGVPDTTTNLPRNTRVCATDEYSEVLKARAVTVAAG